MFTRDAVVAATLALLAMASTTGMASAVNLTAPSKAPAGDLAGDNGGQIASPGDAFLPWRARQNTETYSMSCGIAEGKFANGASIIKIVNTSSKTIPAGSTIEVTYADGSKETFKTSSEIKPGGAVSIMGPPGATPESFSCSASASRKVLVTEQGSPVSNAPTGTSATPPKLTCWFEVVDGKVVVYWKNEGASSVLPGAMITGKTSAGVGVSWYIQEPIKPGQTVSTVLDLDPKFASEACVATVKY